MTDFHVSRLMLPFPTINFTCGDFLSFPAFKHGGSGSQNRLKIAVSRHPPTRPHKIDLRQRIGKT